MSTIKIIKAKYLHDYILRLTFNNGEIRDCDFFPLAQKGICVKLQDIDFNNNTILVTSGKGNKQRIVFFCHDKTIKPLNDDFFLLCCVNDAVC